MIESPFLPGVPAQTILHALARAGGDEIASGKFASPESSAALAVNTFGWFIERPADLPHLPCLADLDWPAVKVEVERQMRFPWSGGRHPWLDAAVETPRCLIGVESKRFEPFRDRKAVSLPDAYDRPVWGARMGPFERLRDDLRSGAERFACLDAVQLVKHAFGLVTEGRRMNKAPVLLYLHAEPRRRGSVEIGGEAHAAHAEEIGRFARLVDGAEVAFAACGYRAWLETWTGAAAVHAHAIQERFDPW